MIRFDCDYTEGCTQAVLDALTKTNMEQSVGYGEDAHCENARNMIKAVCKTDGDVHFLVGGTQTNTVVIKTALRPHQGVIAADSGHISVHESGAIESIGHKVITLASEQGKITAGQIEACVDAHYADSTHEHMVQPAMAYISFPTECGTLYSKAELEAIYDVCNRKGIYLYIDGARLGYGLESDECDLDITDFANLCDAFYIGGTKVGALFGEALVVVNDTLKKDLRYIIKQQGGLLAKGRLLGVQFEALFENDGYFKISRHAIDLAKKLKAGLESKGVKFLFNSPTNQLFPILPDEKLEELSRNFGFSYWQRVDDKNSCVRFCTSWATSEQAVNKLLENI